MITVRQFISILNTPYLYMTVNNGEKKYLRKWQFINFSSRDYRKNVINNISIDNDLLIINVTDITKEVVSFSPTIEELLPIIDCDISLDLIGINSKDIFNINIRKLYIEHETIILSAI